MKGRKKLSTSEKKKPITIFVKAKHYAAAKKAIERIATTIENNQDAGVTGMVLIEGNTIK
jgi:hypothetical protein